MAKLKKDKSLDAIAWPINYLKIVQKFSIVRY